MKATIFFILFMLINATIYAQFQEHIIEYDFGSSDGAQGLVSVDIDNDGDNDIVVSALELNRQLTWIENTGEGQFNNIHNIIAFPFTMPASHIAIGDIDNDNDTDIVAITADGSGCGEIRAFENTNGLGDFVPFSVDMFTCGVHGSIAVGDINDDNKADWISSHSASDANISKTSWFEKQENGNTIEHVINNEYVHSIQLIDIDNDADNDLVGITHGQIFWYENIDNFGNGTIQHTISDLNYYTKIVAKDLDNDGDIDIICAYENVISWFKNDGQENFSSEIIVYTNANNSNGRINTLAIDIDNDNDIDIISTDVENNSILWCKNNGQENFSTEIIANNVTFDYFAFPIFAIDINGDNLIDIISRSSDNRKIAWYENLGTLSVNQNNALEFSIYPNPTKDILKINSNINVSQIEIYNELGVLVLSILDNNNIDISTLSKGIYFIKVFDVNGNVSLKKVIKS